MNKLQKINMYENSCSNITASTNSVRNNNNEKFVSL